MGDFGSPALTHDATSTPTATAPDNRTNHQVDAQPAGEPGAYDTGPSPLALDGWLEFNRVKWNVRPCRLRFPDGVEKPPSVETVVYLDKRGQLYHPPRNPYLPVRFRSTPTTLPYRQTRQWLDVADQLAAEMRRRGVVNTLNFAPELTDARPLQWAGFRAGVRYTLVADLPITLESVETTVRRYIKMADKQGFRPDRTSNMTHVADCLAATEARKGFKHGLSAADLELAASLLGEDHFRVYVCYSPDGEPASVSIILSCPGAPAIGWVSGTRSEHLRAGPVQLLRSYIAADLDHAGITRYDLCGANIRGVAAAKLSWGARLQPYYTIEAYNARKAARWALDWWKFQFGDRSD